MSDTMKIWVFSTLLVALLVGTLAVVACKPNEAQEQVKASFTDVTKKVLYGAQQSFLVVQDSFVKKRKAGGIPDDAWAKWRDAEDKYIASHNAAVKAFNEWLIMKDLSKTEIIARLIVKCFDYLDIATKLWEAWR